MNTQHRTTYTLLFANHFPSFHNTQQDIMKHQWVHIPLLCPPIKCIVFWFCSPFLSFKSLLWFVLSFTTHGYGQRFISTIVCYVQQYCNIYSLFGSHILTWIAMAKSFPSGWLSVRVLSRQSNITNGAPPNKSSIQWYDICSPVNCPPSIHQTPTGISKYL